MAKQQKKQERSNASKHQEKLYHDNFWEFSKKITQGTFDKESHKLTFTKAEAGDYYPHMHSTAPVFDTTHLNWFPHLNESIDSDPFAMSPIKPKEIKAILSVKKSSSAPGPDGITYGIL